MQNNIMQNKIKTLALISAILLLFIYIWALVFKLGNEEILIRNYYNLKDSSLMDRIMWDIIPFNYRGTDYYIKLQILSTFLNCFVFAPFSIIVCYVLKKPKLWKIILISFTLSLCLEITQLFTPIGNPATEDLITNTLSGIIGYAIYYFILKKISLNNTYKIFIVVSAILLIVVIYSIISISTISNILYKILTRTL